MKKVEDDLISKNDEYFKIKSKKFEEWLNGRDIKDAILQEELAEIEKNKNRAFSIGRNTDIDSAEILKEKNIPFEENNIVIDENIINNSIKLKNTEIKIIPNTVYKKLNSSQKEKYFNLKDFISKIDIEKIISSYENE